MTYQRIYTIVRRIPEGRVATYGQVAFLAGLPGHARQVGYALHALPADTVVPWHRVVNAAGRISRRAVPDGELTQQLLLAREGVRLDAGGRLSLNQLQWKPTGWTMETSSSKTWRSSSRRRRVGTVGLRKENPVGMTAISGGS